MKSNFKHRQIVHHDQVCTFQYIHTTDVCFYLDYCVFPVDRNISNLLVGSSFLTPRLYKKRPLQLLRYYAILALVVLKRSSEGFFKHDQNPSTALVETPLLGLVKYFPWFTVPWM